MVPFTASAGRLGFGGNLPLLELQSSVAGASSGYREDQATRRRLIARRCRGGLSI